jgi:hypothetical protein
MTGWNYPPGPLPPGPLPPGAGNAAPGQWPGMTTGQILDRVFRLLRAHFELYVGLAIVPGLAVLSMIVVLGGLAALRFFSLLRHHSAPPNLWSLLWLVPVGIAFYIAIFIVYALYAAAASYAVVRNNWGQPVSAAEAWAVAWRRGGSYVWLTFLIVLIVGGPVYVVLGLGAGVMALTAVNAHSSGAPFIGLAFMPMFMLLNLGTQVYMVLMFLRYGLAFPASVMEDLPAVAALRRSASLTRGGKGRIFVVLLVMYAASFILILVCEMILFFVVGMGVFAVSLAHVSWHSPLLLFIFAPLGLLVMLAVILAVVSLPYAGYTTAFGILYCDQRMRVDGAAPPPLPAAGGQA